MPKLSLTRLGPMVIEKRGARGIREVATEIGISSATLSRVENGKIPDLTTFAKICNWLKIDPSEMLGCKGAFTPKQNTHVKTVSVHMRAHKDLDQNTLQSLTEMILTARNRLADQIS